MLQETATDPGLRQTQGEELDGSTVEGAEPIDDTDADMAIEAAALEVCPLASALLTSAFHGFVLMAEVVGCHLHL